MSNLQVVQVLALAFGPWAVVFIVADRGRAHELMEPFLTWTIVFLMLGAVARWGLD